MKSREIVAAIAEQRYTLVVLRPSPFIAPCEPTLRDRLPKGEDWRYEVKFDGYRMQIHKTGRTITLYTRNGADWTERFPHLTAALGSIPGSAIIDAELVHSDGFEALHRQVHKRIEDDLLRTTALTDRHHARRQRRIGEIAPRATQPRRGD